MLFTNNITIILIAIFFILYFSFHFKAQQKSYFIACASLIFYASWYPPAISLLLYHTLLAYYGAKSFTKTKRRLFAILFFALLPLLFFKYFDFFLSTFELQSFDLLLPLGLSFYTFSMLGYYIDLYNKKIDSNHSFVDILLFVSFWPHLAAGPILRAKQIFSDLYHEHHLTLSIVTLSFILIASGLVKKLLLADNIGAYVNYNISYGIHNMTPLEAWATILGFSAQIYADFSAYSDMAIGFALLLGFRLSANFNYPYRATTITDFWHRWHISLSQWFRDYLYIPLGGSKKGAPRAYVNIMIVFLISGMWHGVGIGFVIWGAIHATLLILEKIFYKPYQKLPPYFRWCITMLVVLIAWSFFRLEYSDALLLIGKMLDLSAFLDLHLASPYYIAILFFMMIPLILDHLIRFYTLSQDGYPIANKTPKSILTLCILLLCALTISGEPLPFIYFEF